MEGNGKIKDSENGDNSDISDNDKGNISNNDNNRNIKVNKKNRDNSNNSDNSTSNNDNDNNDLTFLIPWDNVFASSLSVFKLNFLFIHWKHFLQKLLRRYLPEFLICLWICPRYFWKEWKNKFLISWVFVDEF